MRRRRRRRETGKRRWKGSVATLATGAVLAGIPCPIGIDAKAWRLLAIFLATIVAMVAQPLPSGACALIALDVSVATKTLAFEDAFSAFATQVPWLIFCAMAMAQTMKSTGLGERIAFAAVARFGKTTMGLCYSLVFSEALLAPLIPSVAARAGGIMLPIIVSMSRVCGSTIEDDAQAKMGAFLVASCFQCSAVTSAMFLTPNRPNPLSASFAGSLLGKDLSWSTWALAASVPGLVSILLIPQLVSVVLPPSIKDSQFARPTQNKGWWTWGQRRERKKYWQLPCAVR